METIQIPKDIEETTKKYSMEKGGICGQSCLAVIENTSVQNILNNWEEMGIVFRGWSGWKQLREYLERRNFVVKQKRIKDLEYKEDYFYILRVQWIGGRENKDKPFYGWGHWTVASAHTHFIVVHNNIFFCNEDGLFKIQELENYLEGCGLITSALEIQKGGLAISI